MTTVEQRKPLIQSKRNSSVDDNSSAHQGQYSYLSAFLIFIFPAFGGLLFGYDIGATSAVIPQLQDEDYSGVRWHKVVEDSAPLQGSITSVELLGAMIGCIICFNVADDIGRRKGLLIAACLYFVGAIIEYISGDSSWNATTGICVLVTGRLIYGFGCGFAMHGAPAYIGEMAPAPIRGMLVSLKEAFIVIGIVLGYSIGYSFSETRGGWRITYGISSVFAVVMFIGIWFLPPSCRWLALKGKTEEAIASLKFVHPRLPAEEVESLKVMSEQASGFQQRSSISQDYAMLTSPTVYPAMVAGVGLVIFQQITGQPSVLYYADTIFNDVGVDTVASIGISLFKLIATICATVYVDKYGRKLLLYIGCSLMLIALVILGTAFLFPYKGEEDCNGYTSSSSCPSTCNWNSGCGTECSVNDDDCTCCGATGITAQKGIILASLFLYIGGYQVGYGPIAWLLISEIFPLKVRGKAVSIAVVTNFFFNAVMAFVFPVELSEIGAAATFFIYGIILAIGIYFIYRYVPETKGFTLEQIEDYFLRQSLKPSSSGSSSADEYHIEDSEDVDGIKEETGRLVPLI